MSLLMEALRKAELEKKKAAERLEETIEQAHVTENTGSHRIAQARPGEITTEQPITRLDPTHIRSREELLAATASLSLAPIDTEPHADTGEPGIGEDVTLNRYIDELPQVMEAEGDGETTPATETTLKQDAFGEILEIGAGTPLDETFHDSIVDITSKLPGLYDETVQGEPFRGPERSYDETLPGVSAAELAKDLGEENQPTPVAAQTIFTATATARSPFSYKWPLIIALSAVALIVSGFIIYQMQTPLVREIPPEQMVGDLDLSRLPAVVTDAATTPPAAVTPATGPAPGPAQPEPPSAAGADTQTGPAAASPTVAASAEPPDTLAAAEIQPEEPPLAVIVPDTEATVTATIEESAQLLPAAIPVEPAMIKISRSKAPDGQGLQINDAYSAYTQGDYAGASQRYAEVLRDFPDNRDALLGLGAIAIKSGDMAKAQEIYTRLYRLNPQDNYARAALVNLDNISDPVSRESALKLMIQDNPDSAFLYFSLGNVYAAQSRWAEAQQAFFDAYSNESDNADYALNLAVSLDRIGQARAALDYYHTALQLADDRPAQFDSANILVRIQTLTGNGAN